MQLKDPALLRKDALVDGAWIAADSGKRFAVTNPASGAHCAVLVDRLAGLRNPGQLTRLPDEDGPRPGFAGGRYQDEQGRVWQEIDLALLARQEQFLAIAD